MDQYVSLTAFDSTTDPKILLDYYQRHQILLVRNGSHSSCNISAVTLLYDIYDRFGTTMAKNWSIENAGTSTNHDQLSPLSVLERISSHHAAKKRSRNHLPGSFYVSCILQSDRNDLQSQFLAACPYTVPPFFPQKKDASAAWGHVTHSAPVWLFMGRHQQVENNDEPLSKKGTKKAVTTAATAALTGRVEHTDSVSHSGTWHHQLLGSKTWYVRPLIEAKEWGTVPILADFHQPASSGEKSTRRSQRVGRKTASTSDWRLRIECQTGDLLLINTRLWWHCTSLPLTTTDDVDAEWSVSFARDFYCPQAAALLVDPPSYVSPGLDSSSSNSNSSSSTSSSSGTKEEFCNVDGIYAAKNVRKGQVPTSHRSVFPVLH